MTHPGEGLDDARSVELIERGAHDWFTGWGGCWGQTCDVGNSCMSVASICGGY